MGKALDLLHEAVLEIKEDSSKFLNKDFMMNIFRVLYVQLPELETYRT